MRLTKEHIGKAVMDDNGMSFRVLAVDNNCAWLLELGSFNHATYSSEGPWKTLQEEPKKPSERIMEIINPRCAGGYRIFEKVEAIIQYLDEQFEKKK